VALVEPWAEIAAGEPILQAIALTKAFGGGGTFKQRSKTGQTRAVDEVTFDVNKGETLAIVGESGSGKSTTARMLLNLIEPTSGSVVYRGIGLTTLNSRQMRRVRQQLQMIFQDPYASLHPSRTTFEIVSEGWRVHHGIEDPTAYRKRVDELLTQVGLSTTYANMYPSRLSGGERQRVAIARALALRPEILVLDEPVSALDVSIQAQVIKLLMTLQEELGLTYVFISHDLALVRLLADRVAVMSKGKIVEFGITHEVYSNPTSPYTRSLLDSSPSVLVEKLSRERAETIAGEGRRHNGMERQL
jgi:ABC-type oligopeptide transport system ATPase subunit